MKQRIQVSQKVVAWKNTTYVIEADTPQQAWQYIQKQEKSENSEVLEEAIIDISFNEDLLSIIPENSYVLDDLTGEEIAS
jgi:formate-dependent phosphoribosylglycinamide formyltransferase (GAR transformylase)